MKLKTVSGVMLTLFLVGMLTLAFNIQLAKSEPTIWTVDDDGPADFSSIQEAINAANPGDTVYVYNGTYYENVFVTKAISLIGENRNATIIDGQRYRSVIDVEHANVSISGFTIVNSNIPLCSGIEIDESNYVNITNNIITNNNGYGVEIYGSSYFNIVSDNIITNNQVVGILIYDPYDKAGWNVIKANTITNNNGSGIGISESHENTLEDNVIANQGGGIFFIHAANNTIKNNLIANNQKGISLWGYLTSGNFFFHNNFIINTHQAYGEYISSNAWDDGYPSGGNYWSDHACSGNPSDGSQPYIIDANNIDQYPFQDPNGWLLHQLSVASSPITGIPFTINGTPQTTPYTDWLLEGSYTLIMPETHNGYVWSHWLEDGNTNRVKTITLQGTIWTAVYEPAPKPVGGKATPINMPMNKPETPTLWIWLSTIIASLVLTVVYIKERKKHRSS